MSKKTGVKRVKQTCPAMVKSVMFFSNLICLLKVGNGNVDTALSLVGYDKELEGAMKFVFGSSFVASDLNSAKKVGTYTASIFVFLF